MEELFSSYGYPALFLVSFLAATVIPLGSEWLLVAMLLQGFEPVPVVATATAGNFLGGYTTYLIGLAGSTFLIRTILRIKESSQERAEALFLRYGSWVLFFSWLPIIGDPLCLIGGLFKTSLPRFAFLVITGKLTRYTILAALTGG